MPPMQAARLWALARIMFVEADLRCGAPHNDAPASFEPITINKLPL
jgi:hypothetical protein